jgi:hypothetical protein
MTLAGGGFATAGFSETLGTLTVTAPSGIDMGDGNSVLRFAPSSGQTWSGMLAVNNWSGSPGGGGIDQLFFGTDSSGLTPAQLGEIIFVGFAPGAQILPTGEVVPIPEPGGVVVAGCVAGGLLCRRRRRAAR